MKIKRVYLAAAMLGAVIPYAFFVDFWSTHGFGVIHFVSSWFANGAVGGLAADLLISSLVFWVWMFHRRLAYAGPRPLPFIFINLAIGLSCALPAYLFCAVDEGAAKRGATAAPGE